MPNHRQILLVVSSDVSDNFGESSVRRDAAVNEVNLSLKDSSFVQLMKERSGSQLESGARPGLFINVRIQGS